MTKKIAIQFYGLIRGFRFKKTRDMIYKNIIQELQNQGFEIHIFIYTYGKIFCSVMLLIN